LSPLLTHPLALAHRLDQFGLRIARLRHLPGELAGGLPERRLDQEPTGETEIIVAAIEVQPLLQRLIHRGEGADGILPPMEADRFPVGGEKGRGLFGQIRSVASAGGHPQQIGGELAHRQLVAETFWIGVLVTIAVVAFM
jgi:hypothetical protein